MPEGGLSIEEVQREIAEHAKHGGGEDHNHRRVAIAEAILLSIVALVAAYSGYAAAKWGTESRVSLAEASTVRAQANRADIEAIEIRNFDSSTFGAWFSAFTVHNRQAMAIARDRFRPNFREAFDAWRATRPETNSNAPRGPTYMPEYEQPGQEKADELDAEAEKHFAEGEEAGTRADDFVRVTVYLASVLFLIGISTQFRLRGARLGLVAVGGGMLLLSIIQLTNLPAPPS